MGWLGAKRPSLHIWFVESLPNKVIWKMAGTLQELGYITVVFPALAVVRIITRQNFLSKQIQWSFKNQIKINQ